MKYRRLGKTAFEVSEISLGTWQVGGAWGSGFDDANAEAILEDAIDRGVNFIDTADVYENRQSEAAVARVVRRRSERVYVATKCGRFINPHVDEGYTPEALRGYVEASLKNTGFEALDLIPASLSTPSCLLPARDLRTLRRSKGRRQDPQSGCQRREGRRSAQGHRVPERHHHPDHLQHVSTAAVGALLPGGRPSRCGDHRARAAGQRPVDRPVRQDAPRSARATIATSIARAPPSTREKPSPASPSRPGSKRSKSSRRSSRSRRTSQPSPCAGFSTSKRSLR